MSIDDAKRALLEDEPQEAPQGVRGWVLGHPMPALAAAAGVGLALVMFPKLRKLAIPLLVAAARRAML